MRDGHKEQVSVSLFHLSLVDVTVVHSHPAVRVWAERTLPRRDKLWPQKFVKRFLPALLFWSLGRHVPSHKTITSGNFNFLFAFNLPCKVENVEAAVSSFVNLYISRRVHHGLSEGSTEVPFDVEHLSHRLHQVANFWLLVKHVFGSVVRA